MKNKIYIRILTLFCVSLLLTGCLNDLFDQDSQTFDMEPQLEFRPQTDTFDEDEGTIEVLVQLIGPQRGSDISVAYSVNTGETDAVAGTHYSLVSSSPVTLAANSSAATVTIDLNGTTLDDGDVRTLVLTLDEGNEVTPAENLKNYTLTIEGLDGN
jgi:hypothetical protein